MKICVLQPDYSTTSVDYKNWDPPRDLAPMMPEAEVHHVFLNKLTTYRQLRELRKKGFDIFVNLCEGYPEWEIPGMDVPYSLELLGLPFTGPPPKLYDQPKELGKYIAYCEDVLTPAYAIIDEPDDIPAVMKKLKFPMFVKPAKAGDSLGIDDSSLVNNEAELRAKTAAIIDEYSPLIVEEYIVGREFTVLVAANEDGKTCTTFRAVEYLFPENYHFKTYSLKTSELHPDCNVPCKDPVLDKELREVGRRIFTGFNGVGYARLDLRVTDKGEIYFLEINFTCSVFYKDGYEGSADFVLKYDGIGQGGFLRHIIKEGLARYNRGRKPFIMKGNSISGYGIYATHDIKSGETIFTGEGKAQRLATKRFVENTWTEEELIHFRRYAYPVSEELYILWDEDPSQWAPQNHSCDPNTGFDGLNVVALRAIKKDEELTLDYAQFLDESMEPFQCQCKSPNCRGLILGIKHNSMTGREKLIKKPPKEKLKPSPTHIHH